MQAVPRLACPAGEGPLRLSDYIAVRRAFNLVRQDEPREGRVTLEGLAILCLLDLAPGPLRTSDIASYQRSLRPTLSHRVRGLEALGYLVRTADADDRRSVLVALTPEGRAFVEHSCAACHEVLLQGDVLARVSPERLRSYLVAMGGAYLASADLVLLYLLMCGGSSAPGEVRAGLGLLQPTASMALDSLDRKGLVGRRVGAISLTAAGRSAAEGVAAQVAGMRARRGHRAGGGRTEGQPD